MENNNKKSGITLYLIIITIITAICIIVGVFGRTFHVKGKNRFGNVFTKAGSEVTEEVKTEDFDTVNIELDMGEIVLEEGDNYFVSYAFPEKIKPIIHVNNGALIITQNDGRVLNLEDFSDCKLVVTVPAGTELNSIDVSTDMGNIDINKISAQSVTVSSDMGEIAFQECDFVTLSADSDMGDIKMEDSTLTSADMESSMGEVKMVAVTCDNLTVNVDMGDIKLEGEFNHVNAKTDLGEVEENGVSQGTEYHK